MAGFGGLLLVMLAGCAHPRPPAVDPMNGIDTLARDAWAAAMSEAKNRTPGSLWQNGGLGDRLVADTRAGRVGDLVTVRIEESTKGANEADASLSKDSTNKFGVAQLFGTQNQLDGDVNSGFTLADLFDTDTQKDFTGSGATTRSSSVLTTVTARVFKAFPNGNLAILGRKEVTVNHEHQLLWLVGLIRPEDIDATNALPSTRIAELSLMLTGDGDINDVLREGWFTRWLSRVWPF